MSSLRSETGSAAYSTHKRIIFDPKSPWLLHPAFGIVNSNSWPSRDLTRRNRYSFFKPDAIAQQISLIQFPINSQRDTKPARPTCPFVFGSSRAAAFDDVEA